jgi:hypothetical protein
VSCSRGGSCRETSVGATGAHQDNFGKLKGKQLPMFDEALAALLTALRMRGLLESTAVSVTGEFGRTPKINKKSGRDHSPRAMLMLLAGGSIRGGQVIGASNDKGSEASGTSTRYKFGLQSIGLILRVSPDQTISRQKQVFTCFLESAAI